MYDTKFEVYYKNSDSLYEIYVEKNKKREYYDEVYFYTHRIKSRTLYHLNNKIKSTYFDSLGHIDSMRFFITINNKNINNQLFVFNANGDTDRTKSFFSSSFNLETVLLPGIDYIAYLKLETPKFKHAKVFVYDYNSQNPINTSNYPFNVIVDSVSMDTDFTVLVAYKKTHLGRNYVMFEIVNNDSNIISSKPSLNEYSLFIPGEFYVAADGQSKRKLVDSLKKAFK